MISNREFAFALVGYDLNFNKFWSYFFLYVLKFYTWSNEQTWKISCFSSHLLTVSSIYHVNIHVYMYSSTCTCYEQPLLRHRKSDLCRWLPIGGSFVYKMPFWGMAKWPPIGGWLLIKVAAHSRFYCTTILGDIFQHYLTCKVAVKLGRTLTRSLCLLTEI